jgi:hypothetical protein
MGHFCNTDQPPNLQRCKGRSSPYPTNISQGMDMQALHCASFFGHHTNHYDLQWMKPLKLT